MLLLLLLIVLRLMSGMFQKCADMLQMLSISVWYRCFILFAIFLVDISRLRPTRRSKYVPRMKDVLPSKYMPLRSNYQNEQNGRSHLFWVILLLYSFLSLAKTCQTDNNVVASLWKGVPLRLAGVFPINLSGRDWRFHKQL